jgi:hypothetical protein
MHIVSHTGRVAALLLPVRAPEDLAYLVKESEIVTGRPGRAFVIAGADRPAYRLQWHPLGFQVERLDSRGRALHIGGRSSGLLAPAHHLACALQEGFPAGRRHTWSASLEACPEVLRRSAPARLPWPRSLALNRVQARRGGFTPQGEVMNRQQAMPVSECRSGGRGGCHE